MQGFFAHLIERRALRRVERSKGRFRSFLGGEGVRATASYEEAARALKIGVPAIKTLIHRLRQRHAQLVRAEVERTVKDPNDVEAELRSLGEALVAAEGRVRT